MKYALALVLSGIVGVAATPRASAEPVLRHLAFSVNAGVAQTQEQARTNALSDGSGAGPAMTVSGATSTASSRTIVRGTVTLDVIAVLPSDDALAVLISESGDKTIVPVRIDLLGDGRIITAPGDRGKLTHEELEIAGLCARNYLAGRPLPAGAVWNVEDERVQSNYRVLSTNGERVALVIEQNARGRAAGAGDQRSTIQLTYDTKRSVPVAATIQRRSHLGSLGDLRTIDESFEYRLTSDSFATAAK